MYLWTCCFCCEHKRAKCEKDIEQDISSNDNNINLSVFGKYENFVWRYR